MKKKLIADSPYLFAFVLIFFLVKIHFNISYVPTSSMESTIMTNDLIIGDRLYCTLGLYLQRGDIVMFPCPDNDEPFVKRIIGLPGDTVRIKKGTVYVNDIPLAESYLNEPMETTQTQEFYI